MLDARCTNEQVNQYCYYYFAQPLRRYLVMTGANAEIYMEVYDRSNDVSRHSKAFVHAEFDALDASVRISAPRLPAWMNADGEMRALQMRLPLELSLNDTRITRMHTFSGRRAELNLNQWSGALNVHVTLHTSAYQSEAAQDAVDVLYLTILQWYLDHQASSIDINSIKYKRNKTRDDRSVGQAEHWRRLLLQRRETTRLPALQPRLPLRLPARDATLAAKSRARAVLAALSHTTTFVQHIRNFRDSTTTNNFLSLCDNNQLAVDLVEKLSAHPQATAATMVALLCAHLDAEAGVHHIKADVPLALRLTYVPVCRRCQHEANSGDDATRVASLRVKPCDGDVLDSMHGTHASCERCGGDAILMPRVQGRLPLALLIDVQRDGDFASQKALHEAPILNLNAIQAKAGEKRFIGFSLAKMKRLWKHAKEAAETGERRVDAADFQLAAVIREACGYAAAELHMHNGACTLVADDLRRVRRPQQQQSHPSNLERRTSTLLIYQRISRDRPLVSSLQDSVPVVKRRGPARAATCAPYVGRGRMRAAADARRRH